MAAVQLMTALRKMKAMLLQGTYQDYPLCNAITNCWPYKSANIISTPGAWSSFGDVRENRCCKHKEYDDAV